MVTKTLLWLDDARNPLINDWEVFSPIKRPFQTVWVEGYEDFVNWIKMNGLPDGICFDHDLGTDKTGYDAVKWLCNYCEENCKPFPPYAMQSANTVGRENMKNYIQNFRQFSDIIY